MTGKRLLSRKPRHSFLVSMHKMTWRIGKKAYQEPEQDVQGSSRSPALERVIDESVSPLGKMKDEEFKPLMKECNLY